MSEEVKETQAPENVFEVEKSERTIARDAKAIEDNKEEKPNDNDLKEVGTEESPKKKNRAQERIEKLSREKRELARELEELKSNKSEKDDDLDPDDFDNYDDYLDAVTKDTETKKSKKEPVTKLDDDFQAVLDSIEVKFDETRDKYEDFDSLVQKQPKDGGPHITVSMVEAINEVENSGEVAYALAKDVNESIRISKLSPIKQVIAIDKLSDKLSKATPEVKTIRKVTSAPEPINAIGGGEVTQKSLSKAENFSDYESMRTKEIKKSSW
jgi:hypothetical protein